MDELVQCGKGEFHSSWEEKIKTYRLPRSELNKVVVEYLLKEGFREAVLAFQAEAKVEPPVDMKLLEEQLKIRSAVEQGSIQEAVVLVNNVDPEILDTNSKLSFHLQHQHLLELIQHGDVEGALRFAQEELAAQGEESPEFLDELEQAMALLAYEDASTSPFSSLLERSQRLKVVSEVNAALLSSQNQEPTSILNTLMKLVVWSQHQLETKSIAFPKLTNIASGKLTSCTN